MPSLKAEFDLDSANRELTAASLERAVALRAEIAGHDAKARDPGSGHRDQHREELIVGVEDRGALLAQPGHHLAFGARQPLARPEELHANRPDLGDDADRRPRQSD